MAAAAAAVEVRRQRRGRMRQMELRAPSAFCDPVMRDSLGESVARVGVRLRKSEQREGGMCGGGGRRGVISLSRKGDEEHLME